MRAVFVLLVAAVFVATSYAADEVPKGRINCYQCSSGADDQHECDESDPEKLKKFIKVKFSRHGILPVTRRMHNSILLCSPAAS